MASESGGQIEIEGRRFAWRAVGEGPALLLVNGYAATSADWDPSFLAALGGSFEVICPDNRGIGGSELGADELTIDGMAADLDALLNALEIERADQRDIARRTARRLTYQIGDPSQGCHRIAPCRSRSGTSRRTWRISGPGSTARRTWSSAWRPGRSSSRNPD